MSLAFQADWIDVVVKVEPVSHVIWAESVDHQQSHK